MTSSCQNALPVEQPRRGSNRPQLDGLTSLRFFAAALVLAQHASLNLTASMPLGVANLFSCGYQAVSFFFVLSGFVLVYAYADEHGGWPEGARKRKFWWARVSRIYPAYLLGLAISIPVFVYSAFWSHIISAKLFVSGLVLVAVLLQAWAPPLALAWNSPAWSLSVEACFYALFPFLLKRLCRFQRAWLASCALLVVCCVTLFRARLAAPVDGQLSSPFGNFCAFFPLLFLPHFIFGMALGLLFLAQTGTTLRKWRWLLAPCAVTLCILFLTHSKLPDWMFSDVILVPLFGGMIFGAAICSFCRSGILGARPLVELGDASYSLYILHVPLMLWWMKCERFFGLKPLAGWVSFLGFCGSAILFSVIACRLVEKPARSWLLRRFREPRKAALPAPRGRVHEGTVA